MIKVSIEIVSDCTLAVNILDKVLFIEFPDSEETCETALCIAAILEFTGMYTVKINAFPDDELGNAYVEYYEELKEKGQLIKPLSTAKQMINNRNHYITPRNENQAPKINFKGLVRKDSK